MKYLGGRCRDLGITDRYGFLCPGIISPLYNEDHPGFRTNYVARVLAMPKKVIFAAYNDSRHWVLAAINTTTKAIYWMDPLHNPSVKEIFSVMIAEAFQKRDDADPLLVADIDRKPEYSFIKAPRQPSDVYDGINQCPNIKHSC